MGSKINLSKVTSDEEEEEDEEDEERENVLWPTVHFNKDRNSQKIKINVENQSDSQHKQPNCKQKNKAIKNNNNSLLNRPKNASRETSVGKWVGDENLVMGNKYVELMPKAFDQKPNSSDLSSDDIWSDDESGTKNGLTKPQVQIDRPAFDQVHFRERFQFEFPKNRTIFRMIRRIWRVICGFNLFRFFLQIFPFFTWIQRYQWRSDLLRDFSAGFTVAVMHIPQGMAYAILSSVDPIVGIYTAFFPVMVYIFMGTSRHISLGTFAVISMLVSKTVHTYAFIDDDPVHNALIATKIQDGTINKNYTAIQVATAVTFVAGIFQLMFYVLRLGVVCSLLSHAQIRGFTTGAAIHVFSSQVKCLLGIKLPSINKPFGLFEFYGLLFDAIGDTNLVTLTLSLSVLLLLEFYSWFLEDRITKCLKGINFPIHLLVVLLGISASFFMDLNTVHNVVVVGKGRTGFPSPEFPPKELFLDVAADAFIIAVVCYVVTYSLGILFANKHKYKISSSQELLALGMSNIFGSFFHCLPVSASLSRTSVQDNAGCKTLITSAFSVFILLWVLLFAGPLFEPLPNAVLSAIIIQALKGMFKQFSDLSSLAKTSSYTELSVWIISFVATVVFGVDLGLVVGVAVNVIIILSWSLFPTLEVVAITDFKDLNVNPNLCHEVRENGTLLIIRIVGSWNFSNSVRTQYAIENIIETRELDNELKKTKYVLLDMTSVPFMDLSACLVLVTLFKNVRTRGVTLMLVGLSGALWDRLECCQVFDDISKSKCYPTLQDALTILEHKDKKGL